MTNYGDLISAEITSDAVGLTITPFSNIKMFDRYGIILSLFGQFCKDTVASTTKNGGAHTQACPRKALGKSGLSIVHKKRSIELSFTLKTVLPATA